MELMNKIVIDLIEEHEGGEEFFNHLDKRLQNSSIIKSLIAFHTGDEKIVASGKFGLYLNAVYPQFGIVLVNGGLRKGNIISLEPMRKVIQDNDFIFIDDSFFLGRTRNAIKEEIEKWGGSLIRTIVGYDGSKEKDNSVTSLYRYYDHFGD